MKRYERGERMMASQIPWRLKRALKNRGFSHILPALLVLLAATSLTAAAPVAVTNPSFEANVVSDGAWTPNATGWVLAGSAGTLNPTTASHFPVVPEGMNTLFSNGGTATQTMSVTLAAWTQYTLSVHVGQRLDSSGFPGYRVELGVDNAGVFAPLAQDDSSVSPPLGGFLMSTVNLVVPIGNPNIGKNLAIRLRALGGQVNFDAVGVSASAVPPTGAIFVGNPGFEAVILAEGAWNAAIPEWTKSGSALCGTFNPHDTNNLTGGSIEGNNNAFCNPGIGMLSQILPETLTADTSYTLTVQLGDRLDNNFPGYAVQLGVNDGAGTFTTLVEDNNSLTPDDGWLLSTVMYTTSAVGGIDNARLGQSLEIRLISQGAQTQFDDVNLTAGPSGGPIVATEHYLIAKEFTKVMPDGREVDMWGFARDANDDLTDADVGEVPTVPGPMVVVPPGSTSLTIHLRNDLLVPVSLMIPGLSAPLNPTWVTPDGTAVTGTGSRPNPTGGDYTSRVRSFATETAPGLIGTYTWVLQPGTYLYQSGTHPSVQVQMGLYGGAKVDHLSGEAYPDPESGMAYAYDNEVVLLYSEVDPDLHDAVVGGTFGTAAYPSTVQYLPRYFLINGDPYPTGGPVVNHSINTGERVLVRLLNAGLQNRAPLFQGLYVDIVAEDGNLYPYAREQYSVLMQAGKTKDAFLLINTPGDYPVYDRRLALSNGGGIGIGGHFAELRVANEPGKPLAADDHYDVAEDGVLTVLAPNGVLANDSDADNDPLMALVFDQPVHGMLNLMLDGSFVYTPTADFSGADLATYQAFDGSQWSNIAYIAFNVMAVNDPPVAVLDGYNAAQDTVLTVGAPGVLANDTDLDGDMLDAIIDCPIPAIPCVTAHGMVTLNTDGSFVYTPDALYDGPDSFSYYADDGMAQSATPAIVSLTVVPAANQPPVALDVPVSIKRNDPGIILPLAAYATDADGTIVPASLVVVTPPRWGSVVNHFDGTVTYTPKRNFRGTDTFTYTVDDDEGATSNVATVRINVTR